MDSTTIQQLLDLNHRFYQTFAQAFDETRQQVQLGVRRVMQALPSKCALLDLGCGNGNLARFLLQHGFQGQYIGLDASQHLLTLARGAKLPPGFQFVQSDLADPSWVENLPAEPARYLWVVCFATLHHLPGVALRRRLLKQIHERLENDGRLALSVWDFMASERWRARILPWEQAGLDPKRLESGDTLLDWRHGGPGVRYVHHFTEVELAQEAYKSGYEIEDDFHSDGKGGRLGHYQIWRPLRP